MYLQDRMNRKKRENMQVYLDNSATTKQCEEVTQTMIRVMEDNFGNPSSLHSLGLKAEKEVREARKNVAAGQSTCA